MLRAHQAEMQTLAVQIATGQRPGLRYIGAHVACGGGKQALAGILGHYVVEHARLCDRMCWIVPNGNLRYQAADSLSPGAWLGELLGHQLTLYENRNTPNPSHGRHGYVVTYHAICAAPDLHRQEFERHRYLLVLDEPHHLQDHKAFWQAVRPLWERAALVLLMSGTLDRDDRQRIAPLPYLPDGHVDMRNTGEWHWLRYSRRQALAERAVLPVDFIVADGQSRWVEHGLEHRAASLGDNRTALFAALRTEYAEQLLAAGARHWAEYRRRNPRSKLLVVCESVKQAGQMVKLLRRMGHADAVSATHADDDADAVIREFSKRDDRNVLVTVQKTYEGLDVPAITHLIALTAIRSRPWVEQMLARAWRYDERAGPWERQRAYVWAPDDDLFRAIIREIEAEQQEAIREREAAPEERATREREDDPAAFTVQYIDSQMTVEHALALDGERLSAIDTEILGRVGARYGLSAIEMRQAIEEYERAKAGEAVAVRNGATSWPDLTPQQRLDAAKRELDALVKETARRESGDDPAQLVTWVRSINRALVERYGHRAGFGEDQAVDAIAWLRRTYGS